MCCGKHWSIAKKYPNYEKDVASGKWWKIWEYRKVRECYKMVSIDGSPDLNDFNTPENMFLVCHSCYMNGSKVPDFFYWMYDQRDIWGDEAFWLKKSYDKYKDKYNNADEFSKKWDELEREWKLISPYFESSTISELADNIFGNESADTE